MDASDKEDILEDVQIEGRSVTLDLAFLCNTFLREGSEFHFKVVKGLPEGAKAIAGGIVNDALVMVFDIDVPPEVWFEDRGKKVIIPGKEIN